VSPIKSASVLLLAVALTGGPSVNAVLADLPSKPQSVKAMDTNRNGKIEKQEYLAFMGKAFDNLAGAKGYCTYTEVKTGLRNMSTGFWEVVD
jgi:hypothetical protein